MWSRSNTALKWTDGFAVSVKKSAFERNAAPDGQQISHYVESALIGIPPSALSLALLYQPNCNYLARAAFNLRRELSLVKAMRPPRWFGQGQKNELRGPPESPVSVAVDAIARAFPFHRANRRELNLKTRPCQLCDELGKWAQRANQLARTQAAQNLALRCKGRRQVDWKTWFYCRWFICVLEVEKIGAYWQYSRA